ncbi:MAG: hypothetical protein J6A19_16490 [Oscillospiraceae bacterium]|nr:hypothetical protein [Oscillospiraceae bacterium]
MKKYKQNMEVCISVEALYEKYGERLWKCRIEADETYYDLYNSSNELACCDGETAVIDRVTNDSITFVNTEGGTPKSFTLT